MVENKIIKILLIIIFVLLLIRIEYHFDSMTNKITVNALVVDKYISHNRFFIKTEDELFEVRTFFLRNENNSQYVYDHIEKDKEYKFVITGKSIFLFDRYRNIKNATEIKKEA